MRIYARDNTLHFDDKFQLKLKIGEQDKLLTGRVMNCKVVPPDFTEYGCRLVSMDGELH
jgi:hypothetical protein